MSRCCVSLSKTSCTTFIALRFYRLSPRASWIRQVPQAQSGCVVHELKLREPNFKEDFLARVDEDGVQLASSLRRRRESSCLGTRCQKRRSNSASTETAEAKSQGRKARSSDFLGTRPSRTSRIDLPDDHDTRAKF